MTLKPLSALCCAVILASSCTPIYTTALYQDIAYQPKPTTFDSVRSANYASIAYNLYTTNGKSDGLFSGQVNLSRATINKHVNIAYGAFGVFGDYENGAMNKNKPNYFADKFFGKLSGDC